MGPAGGPAQAPFEIVGMGSAQESRYGAVLGGQSQRESGVLLHVSPAAKSSPYGAAHCPGAMKNRRERKGTPDGPRALELW